MTLIDPEILQAIALGTNDDPYLPDGRHVRWFFNRLLGFPRSGFRLRRRPSPLEQDWGQPPATPGTRLQALGQSTLGLGSRKRFASGLTVAKQGGFVFGPVTAGGDPLLRLDDRSVALGFGAEGAVPPISGDLLSNPAAYVLLTIARRARTGRVEVAGYYDATGARRLIDRGAVGPRRPLGLLDWVALAVSGRARAERVRTGAERLIGTDALSWRDRAVAASLTRSGRGLRWDPPDFILDLNPFVTETILLHGGLLEHVELHGRDATIVQVQWITTRDELAASDWTDFGVFHLPLTDAPAIYPAWTPEPGLDVARKRLELAPPKVAPPWDAGPVAAALEQRYLGAAGEEFKAVDVAMREFLQGELVKVVPQALVSAREDLEPEDSDDAGPEAMSVTFSPFDLLYGAAGDPQMARMLGLMTSDFDLAAGAFDYAVEAAFPLLWLRTLLDPRAAKLEADELRAALGGAPLPWAAGESPTSTTARLPRPFRGHPCASLVTGIARGVAPLPTPPSGLAAHFVPDAQRQPVQGRMQVSWQREQVNLFEHPDRARILYAFRRDPALGGPLLHHEDDETGLLAPHLPTPHSDFDQRLRLTDRDLPSYGLHTWEVSGMDLFGRMSEFAAVTADVRDVVPPPAPAAVDAAIIGDALAAPVWPKLVIGFDWPAAHAVLAPDLARFEVHLRQGEVTPEDATLDSTWGRLEHEPGATTPPLALTMPGAIASATSPPLEVTSSITTDQSGGHRITVELGAVEIPFDAEGFARMSVSVRAVDGAGNTSGFATPARPARADAAPPTVPPAPAAAQLATIPDARNRSFFKVALPATAEDSMQVMRASSSALLASGGTPAAEFEALSESDQVALLKALAAAHPDRFAPDQETPYPAGTLAHVMELGGFERGLSVATVIPISKTQVRASWPTIPSAFVVIRVPHPRIPRPPWIRRVIAGDRNVRLEIEHDPTGVTATLQLYRARSADEASDVRRMRPLAPIAVAPLSTQPIEVLDEGLWPDAEYFYRAVAVSSAGTRSEPTEPLSVRPFGTTLEPLDIAEVSRELAQPARRNVTCLVPRRDYEVRLLRRRQDELVWASPDAARVGDDGVVDVSSFTTAAAPAGGYTFVVEDTVPNPVARYAYFIRVEDPRGDSAESAPRLEAP